MNFVLVFRVPERQSFSRPSFPARGGGDIRWLAQNYTGRTSHTATKQDQLKIGFRQGLDRVPGARWLARKVFPDGGVTRIESYGSDPVGGQLLVSACGLGRASASWALWRMAVGAALPLFAGRVAASVFDGNGRMFRLSRGYGDGFGAIFRATVGVQRERPDAGWRRVNSKRPDWGCCCPAMTGDLGAGARFRGGGGPGG